MKFSEQELICFNSILDGKTIFGTSFSAPDNIDHKYYDETVNHLKNHNMLTDNKPNINFTLAAKTLDEYKKADAYIYINGSRIALTKGIRYMVILSGLQEGYELTAIDKSKFLYQFILSYSFLANKNETDNELFKCQEMLQWQDTLEEHHPDSFISLYKIKNGDMKEMYFLYNYDSQGFLYDPIKKELKQSGSLAMRKQLIRTFEMPEEWEVKW